MTQGLGVPKGQYKENSAHLGALSSSRAGADRAGLVVQLARARCV